MWDIKTIILLYVFYPPLTVKELSPSVIIRLPSSIEKVIVPASVDVPSQATAVADAAKVAFAGTIFALPLKLVPPIVLGVASTVADAARVAVAASPDVA